MEKKLHWLIYSGFSILLYGNYLNFLPSFCLTNYGYSLQLIVTQLIVNKRYLEADPYSLFMVNSKS